MLKDEQIYKNVAQQLRQKAGLLALRKQELFSEYGEACFTSANNAKKRIYDEIRAHERVIQNYHNAAALVEKLGGKRDQTDALELYP